MRKIRENSAGIDIGAKKVFVYVEGQQVKSFFTFTEDFEAVCQYLKSHHVKSVAMEATGVYWAILYEMIEESGIDAWLVDGRQTKQVPGRKTDVNDCQWIQELHSLGLLNRSFVVKDFVKELRAYQRLREDHIRSASMHINHLQKVLTQMNIRLKEVLSQVHGVSGLKIIEAILAGERDRNVLLGMCDTRIIKNKKTELLKSLEGKYTHEGLFALRQALEAYKFYQQKISECDKEIERIIQKNGGNKKNIDQGQKRKPIRHNKPEVQDLGANLINIFEGKDATLVSGVTDYTWLRLLSETGHDLSRWPSEKQWAAWLGLAPGQHWSGKMRRNKRKKGHPKAGQIFREIAQSLLNSKNIAIGAFGRRIRSKKGSQIAIKAMARKLAILYWRVMMRGMEYAEQGVEKYEKQLLARKQKSAERLAKELNLKLVDIQSFV